MVFTPQHSHELSAVHPMLLAKHCAGQCRCGGRYYRAPVSQSLPHETPAKTSGNEVRMLSVHLETQVRESEQFPDLAAIVFASSSPAQAFGVSPSRLQAPQQCVQKGQIPSV